MKKKYKINNKVKYGENTGIIKFVDYKNKLVFCIFDSVPVFSALFDFRGRLHPIKDYIENDFLEMQ